MMIAALCALAVPLQAQGAERRASTGATGGKAVKAAPAIASPPAGMGQVVFYRSSKKGMLIGCKVRENEVAVNKLSAGKYFVHPTTPGAHEYMVKSEAKDRLRLEVEEGETHYVRCSIGMGIAVGRPNLSPQSRADFDKRGKKLKLQSPYKGDAEEAEPASGTN
jgi:hypothetical protein